MSKNAIEKKFVAHGPSYLDFITPDDVFDKGPAEVKRWQEAKAAEITAKPDDRS